VRCVPNRSVDPTVRVGASVVIGAVAEVGQAAAPRGIPDAGAVVADLEGDPVGGRGEVDLGVGGPGVAGGVGEGLAQNGEQVVRDGSGRVSSSPENRTVGSNPSAGVTSATMSSRRARRPRDGVWGTCWRAKIAVRIWLMVASRSTTVARDAVGGPAGAERGRQGLQRHAAGEQALDDVVVQVGGDAFALVEQRGALLVGARPCELERHGGLVGEAGGQVEVLGGEGLPPAPPNGGEHAVHGVRAVSSSGSSTVTRSAPAPSRAWSAMRRSVVASSTSVESSRRVMAAEACSHSPRARAAS
jgi:hypothetical protein